MLTSFAASTACVNRYSSSLRSVLSTGAARLVFLAALLLCPLTAPGQPAAETLVFEPAACRTAHYDEKVSIKSVIDGDTVILADDRHIRLIGVNTPEISHDDRPGQPGADQAYNYLNNLLHAQKTVHLHYDEEHNDRYGRTLAHLFLVDGTNIQSLLLTRGLATTLTIPPNLAFLDCYEASTAYAQSRGIGLWALRQYQPMPASALDRGDLGYRIITGRVMRTGNSKSNFWIHLEKNLTLRIASRDLQYFGELAQLTGQEIRASGRLYFSNGEYRMQIHHPSDLKITRAPEGN